MANNTIQFKRTSTSGLLPNTTSAVNNAYIPAGSFAVNLTDKKVHSSDGALPFEVGSNLTNQNVSSALNVGNSTVNTYITGTQVQGNQNDTVSTPAYSWSTDTSTGVYRPVAGQVGITAGGVSALLANSTRITTTLPISTANSTVNGGIFLANNNSRLSFATVNTAANSYFIQQNDDNFVFYSTNTVYGQRAIWSIFANSITSNLNISVRTQMSGGAYLPPGTTIIDSTGSQGTIGQVLTSNGTSNVYWSTVTTGGGGVNTANQYVWSNVQTFNANAVFGGSIGIYSGNAIYLNGLSDANWEIGRSTGDVSKWAYTGNTIDIVIANSPGEGFVIGLSNSIGQQSYLETGYKGTYIYANVTIGNSTSNSYITSTFASLSGNLNVGSSSTNNQTQILSNSQINPSGSVSTNAYLYMSGAGGNYLAFGQSTTFSQWIQAGFNGSSTYYPINLNPLGGNVSIGSITTPTATLTVTGTANVSTSVNSALFTVGTTTVANSTGVYATQLGGLGATSFVSNASAVSTYLSNAAAVTTFVSNSALVGYGYVNNSVGTAFNSSNLGGFGVTTFVSNSALTSYGYINSTSGTVTLARGGTNSSLTAVSGGVVYSNTTGLAITTAGSNTFVLTSNGTAPAFAQIDLTYLPESCFKKSVRAATTADLAAASVTAQVITGTLVAFPAQDGVSLIVNDRLLVKNQSNAVQNGIYYVSNTGSAGVYAWTLTRSADANTSSRIASAIVAVDEGTTNAGKVFDNYFKPTDTIGTTSMPWYSIFDSSGGTIAGLTTFTANVSIIGNATFSSIVTVGGATVNTTINATSFSGTANNATNFNGLASTSYLSNAAAVATYVSNASAVTTLVSNASAVVRFVSNASFLGTAYTFTGTRTHNANVSIAGNSTAQLAVGGTALISNATTLTMSNSSIAGFLANINTQTTSYVLIPSDSGKIIEMANSTAATTITLPATIPAGFNCTVVQVGTSNVTFSNSAGATLSKRSTGANSGGQWAMSTVYVRTNVGGSAAAWVLGGDTV